MCRRHRGEALRFTACWREARLHAGERGHRYHRARLGGHVHIIGPRAGLARGPAHAIGLPDDDQSIGAGEGDGATQHPIEDAEQRGVGADAEGEGENRGEREAWRVLQLTNGVSHVAHDGGESIAAAGVARLFAHLLRAPEGQSCATPGFVARHPLLFEASRRHLDVELYLVLVFAITTPASERPAQPREPIGEGVHGRAPLHARMAFTAADERSHPPCSATSRRRPAAVSS
jgi:hypothetical protein